MKRIPSVLALLALMGISYKLGLSRNSEVAHAEEISRWTKVEIPLNLSHEDRLGLANAQGFWQSTSTSKDKQLAFPVAVKIECDMSERICRESQASVLLGVLQADLLEYDITSWTAEGVVADEADEGECGIGHRLSLDFKSNSVTVTDYPKRVTTNANCKPFQDASSYSLHGGQLMLYPPAPWDPLVKSAGKK